VQDVLTVPNEVAAELAGVGDGVLDALRERLGCSISLRGNRLTLDGDERASPSPRGRRRARRAGEGGHAIGPDTVGAVVAALDQAATSATCSTTSSGATGQEDRAEDGHAEALRRRDPRSTVTFGIGPAAREDVPRDRARR
jgi:phosphate starvation-inducible protein PhoH